MAVAAERYDAGRLCVLGLVVIGSSSVLAGCVDLRQPSPGEAGAVADPVVQDVPQPRVDPVVDRAAVEEAVRAHWAAINARDAAAVSAQHTDGLAIIMTEVGARFRAPSSTADSIFMDLAANAPDFAVEDLEVELLGDVAIASFYLGGGVTNAQGVFDWRRRRVTEVWTRQDDGTWSEAHHHDSVFEPLPTRPGEWTLNGEFGLADRGQFLLPVRDEVWAYAVCRGSEPLPLDLDRMVSRADTVLPRWFEYQEGVFYRIRAGEVSQRADCFITDATILGARVTPLQPENADCSGDTQAELASRHGRSVVRCSILGRFAGGTVHAAQLEWEDTSGLAVVTLQVGARQSAWLLPATDRDGGSAWRVDDGGQFEPEHIQPLFVVQSGSNMYVALNWAGAEGASLTMLRAEGDTLTEVRSDYRYFGGG